MNDELLRGTIALQDHSIEMLEAKIAKLEAALKRLASPEAFNVSRMATPEETARMKYAEEALAAVDKGES